MQRWPVASPKLRFGWRTGLNLRIPAAPASSFKSRPQKNKPCAASDTDTRALTTEIAVQRSGKMKYTSPGGQWEPGRIERRHKNE